jgi:hypothetical protein
MMVFMLCPSVLDPHVATLDKFYLRQASLKCGDIFAHRFKCRTAEKTDHRHRRLLRARRKRPRRRAAEQ